MKKSAVIFQYRESTPKKREGLSRAFKGMTVGALLGILVLFSPMIAIETKYRVAQLTRQDKPVEVVINETKETPVAADSVSSDMDTSGSLSKRISARYIEKVKPEDESFSIIIPGIGVNSRVIPQIDPSNKERYSEALKKGAVHAAGTSLPGQGGSTFIFAHSADYVWNILDFNAVFYLLKDIKQGDTVMVVYNGKVYPYKVRDTKVVEPRDTEYLSGYSENEELVLQTCWPPGTTWKRLLVFAEPADAWEAVQTN